MTAMTLVVSTLATACAGAAGSGSHSTPTSTTPHLAAAGVPSEVTALLAGIPQRGNRLGKPGAPLTVQFFGDLQCPYCRLFALSSLNTLISRYVRPGKLNIEYRSLRSATHDPETFVAQQVAALAAGKQNRLWNFVELFYREQREEDSGYVTEAFLDNLAQQVPGLNLVAWTASRGDAELARLVIRDALSAHEHSLKATPAFLLVTHRKTNYANAIARLLQSY
jgi:protein-disulfide isomerase